jgi:hypothetical protein
VLATRLRRTDEAMAAISFMTVQRAWRVPCSNWVNMSAKMTAPGAL